MQKIATLLILLLFVSYAGNAQRILPQKWMDYANVGDRNISVGNSAMLFGNRNAGVDGDYYWDKEWKAANVYFYKQAYTAPGGKTVTLDSVNNIDLKIDIWNDLLEFNAEGGIKVIPAKYVSNVLTRNNDSTVTQFINPREFGRTDIKGFFELLSTGKKGNLLTSREIIRQAANYNPALGTGNQNDQLVKKDHFFWFGGGTLTEIKSAKDFLELTGEVEKQLQAFVKNEKIRGKSKEDFKALADYYNQL